MTNAPKLGSSATLSTGYSPHFSILDEFCVFLIPTKYQRAVNRKHQICLIVNQVSTREIQLLVTVNYFRIHLLEYARRRRGVIDYHRRSLLRMFCNSH